MSPAEAQVVIQAEAPAEAPAKAPAEACAQSHASQATAYLQDIVSLFCGCCNHPVSLLEAAIHNLQQANDPPERSTMTREDAARHMALDHTLLLLQMWLLLYACALARGNKCDTHIISSYYTHSTAVPGTHTCQSTQVIR